MSETPQLSVSIHGTERRLRGITQYSLDSGYTTPTDAFSVTIARDTDSGDDSLEWLIDNLLAPCELLINGASQMLGRIEKLSGGSKGASVTISGRDYLSDLIECHADPTYKIAEQATLASFILDLAGPVGIRNVGHDGDFGMRNIRTGRGIASPASPEFAELALKDHKISPGDGILETFEKICARHGCTVQPGPDRQTLVLSAPNYTQQVSGSLRRALKSGGNIIEGSAERDLSSFPTLLIASGKGGGAAEARSPLNVEYDLEALSENFNTELSKIVENCVTDRVKPGTVGDPNLLYRLHVYDDKDAKTPDQLTRSARRRISEFLKPTLSYGCTVQGHENPDGGLWAVDTMLQVRDELWAVDEPLWVANRTFGFDNGGAVTRLELWRPGTYQL